MLQKQQMLLNKLDLLTIVFMMIKKEKCMINMEQKIYKGYKKVEILFKIISVKIIFNKIFQNDEFDDVLRQFFGNQFRRRRNRREEEEEVPRNPPNQHGFSWFLQFLPLILIILLPTLLGNIGSSLFGSFNTPPFSVQKTNVYFIEKTTFNGNLHYYVKQNFESEWPKYFRSKYQLEHQVVMELFQHNQNLCEHERNLKYSKVKEAQWYFKGEERTRKIEEAEKIETKSCDRVQELKSFLSR